MDIPVDPYSKKIPGKFDIGFGKVEQAQKKDDRYIQNHQGDR